PDVCRQNKAPVITSGKVMVVDLSTQQELPAGEEGEIWCSGPTLMLGYYKQEEETRKTITEDGWLRTGDLGRFDAEGNLQVTGRIKDIVKVGGTNVSPTEVENLLMANPAVEFAVVVGVPDERLGEVTYAYVKTAGAAALSRDALIADCRARMANYKVPRHVRFMDEFPRLSTGKIDRKQLGDAARAEVAPGA
ncbi:MAG: AMP-binding protein, partial [Burkholderiaceae bacterium]|nr:AMP-binding protein [Burkholderiaceae bacterium]